MQSFHDEFRLMGEAMAPIFIVAAICIVLELKFSWRVTSGISYRWFQGTMLVLFGWLLVALILPGNALFFARLAEANQFGVFATSGLPMLVMICVGVLALDLTAYLIHRAMHLSPALWRLHAVHHSDETLDASTALRFHPIEFAITAASQALVVYLLGLPISAVSAYFTIALLFNMWEHANIRSGWVPYIVRAAVITPDLHRIHHSSDPKDHDRNFGTVLSFWDRIFGTLKTRPEHEELAFGLDKQAPCQDQSLLDLLLGPFWAQGRHDASQGQSGSPGSSQSTKTVEFR
ncbi:MAG: sterol desaturase family protein [Pseudomonadota bacterium]